MCIVCVVYDYNKKISIAMHIYTIFKTTIYFLFYISMIIIYTYISMYILYISMHTHVYIIKIQIFDKNINNNCDNNTYNNEINNNEDPRQYEV